MPIGHHIPVEEAVVEKIVDVVIHVSNHRAPHVDDAAWDVDIVAARRKLDVTFAK
jgi:hypothetical protein